MTLQKLRREAGWRLHTRLPSAQKQTMSCGGGGGHQHHAPSTEWAELNGGTVSYEALECELRHTFSAVQV